MSDYGVSVPTLCVLPLTPRHLVYSLHMKQFLNYECPVGRTLFGDTRMAWFWAAVRLWLGWEWIWAGWEKLLNPAWVGSGAGRALSGFAQNAISQWNVPHSNVAWWYAAFLNNVVVPHTALFSYLVTFGELAVGIALVLGAVTGVAAFFGAFLNLNFLLAGTVSISPVMLVGEVLLMFAWRTAGWYGLDRFINPLLARWKWISKD